MIVEEKIIEIPAKTEIIKTYIAGDGKKFSDSAECLDYERQQRAIQNIKNIRSKKVENLDCLNYDISRCTAYYINDEKEFSTLLNYTESISKKHNSDKITEYSGKDWYLLLIDYRDCYTYIDIISLSTIIDEYNCILSQFISDIPELNY